MKKVLIVVLLGLLLTTPAFAAGLEEIRVYPSIQYFTWEEFSDTGRSLLTEDGPLFGIGTAADFDLYGQSLYLRAKGELFGGQVNYDGETSDVRPQFDGLPVKTDVNYFGGKLEADAGWRLRGQSGHLEPFAGLGYRHWMRNLEASSTVDRSSPPQTIRTGETTEVWLNLYTRLGMRGELQVTPRVTLFFEGGAKYPIYTSNEVDDITLEPGSRWSAFAEAGLKTGRFRPTFFYEGFRFSQSPAILARDGSTGILVQIIQPRSESDIFGFNFAFSF